MKGFLADLYLRPSCYNCPAKSGKSLSDITIADYWGVQNVLPSYYDKSGVGLALIHSNNGQRYFDEVGNALNLIEQDYKKAITSNIAYYKSVSTPKQRNVFWRHFSTDGVQCIELITETMKPTFVKRVLNRIAKILK